MNILALDTSTEACSVALLTDQNQYARFDIKPNQHARLLLPMVEKILAEAKLSQHQLDAVAFGRGPGSFTGLRIAASVAQGIAFAQNLPVIPISSLEAMAQAAYQEFGYKKIATGIDAHVQSLYYALFTVNEENGNVKNIIPEQLVTISDWKQNVFSQQDEWHYMGTGWRYFNFDATIDYYPKASAILALAKEAFEQKKWVSPEQALPVYLHELNYLQR